MTEYADYQPDTAPPWLQRDAGRAFLYVLGLVKDAWLEAAKRAVKARFASIAPPDAIAYLLRDYDLPERFNESEDIARARILDAWRSWELAGTPGGVVHALNTAGFANVSVQERINAVRWWEYRVVLRPAFPWDHTVLPYERWGAATWGEYHYTGGAPTLADRDRVLTLVRKWAPAHAHLDFVVVQISGPTWGSFAWGDGTTWNGIEDYWR